MPARFGAIATAVSDICVAFTEAGGLNLDTLNTSNVVLKDPNGNTVPVTMTKGTIDKSGTISTTTGAIATAAADNTVTVILTTGELADV